jgi:uncharacterized membrane protein YccC
MTPEQEAQQAQTVARIRKERTAIGRDFDECEQPEEAKDYDRLLEIVDSQAQKIAELQGRVKQYTESELREAYEMHFETAYDSPSVWQGFKDCARFLGAIKEKEG